MVNDNPVGEALALLQQEREDLVGRLSQVDEAIAALKKLMGRGRPSTPADPNRPSVRTKVLRLLDEAARDWSAGEIIEEYRRRDDPIHGRDPSNALRAALADAKKKGMIVSTGVGRYKSAKWSDGPNNGSDPSAASEAPLVT